MPCAKPFGPTHMCYDIGVRNGKTANLSKGCREAHTAFVEGKFMLEEERFPIFEDFCSNCEVGPDLRAACQEAMQNLTLPPGAVAKNEPGSREPGRGFK